MKKIVSVLAVTALTLGAAFAEVSLEYTSKGYLLDRTTTKIEDGDTTTTTTILDQSGYADASNCMVFKLSSDFAGVVFDVDPNASTASYALDQYYGWANFGNLKVQSGLWTSRDIDRVKQDAGNWEGSEFEAYKPGVMNGTIGKDVDNLTGISGTQKLSTTVGYTVKDVLPGSLTVTGAAVTNAWGTLNDKNTLSSGVAAEVAYKQDGVVNINAVFKSMVKQQFALALFVNPIMVEKLDVLAGFTYAKNYADDASGDALEYYEWGADLRARYAVSDMLSVTTMNNITQLSDDSDNNSMYMWNMVNATYVVTPALKAQFTVQHLEMLSGKALGTSIETADVGGHALKFIPGVVLSAGKNASLTTGVIIGLTGVGASSDYKKSTGTTTTVQIPVVFDVAL